MDKPTTIFEAALLDAMQQAIWTQEVANEAKKQLLKLLVSYQRSRGVTPMEGRGL